MGKIEGHLYRLLKVRGLGFVRLSADSYVYVGYKPKYPKP